jgi:cell division protein FtsB
MSARAHADRRRSTPRYRARPAPRGRTRRRGSSRIDWERLGRRVLVLVLFAVLVSYLNPVINLIDDWRDSKAEQERLADLQQENARLAQRAEALEDPEAAEQEARRLGMVAPDERAYVIRGLSR